MPFTTYESSNEETFLPLYSKKHKKNANKYSITVKNTAAFTLAAISAMTHATNSFMAVIALINMLENTEPKTLGQILTEGTLAVSSLSLSLASLAGLSSELVNCIQAFDYIPKLKQDLINLTSPSHKTRKQKFWETLALVSSLGAASTSAFFAWGTYESVPSALIRLPLSVASSSVAFVMTLSSRFVKTKKFLEEHVLIDSPEDAFLMKLTHQLQYCESHLPLNLPDTSIENPKLTAVVHHFMTVLQQCDIPFRDKETLELVFSHLMHNDTSNFTQYSHQIYTWLTTSLVAIVYSERLAHMIPRTSGYIAIPWDIIRLGIGAILSSPHIITYYASAQELPTSIKSSLLTSKEKTTGFLIINIGASLSLVNYYLTVANIQNPKPTIPLPNQTTPTGLLTCLLAMFAGINPNFPSCADLCILPPPSPMAQTMIKLRENMTEQKPVHQRKIYTQSIRQVQSLLFKPPKPKDEHPGCLTRLRARLGW